VQPQTPRYGLRRHPTQRHLAERHRLEAIRRATADAFQRVVAPAVIAVTAQPRLRFLAVDEGYIELDLLPYVHRIVGLRVVTDIDMPRVARRATREERAPGCDYDCSGHTTTHGTKYAAPSEGPPDLPRGGAGHRQAITQRVGSASRPPHLNLGLRVEQLPVAFGHDLDVAVSYLDGGLVVDGV